MTAIILGRILPASVAVLVLLSGCGQVDGDPPWQGNPAGDGRTATAAPAGEACGEIAGKVERHVRRPGIRSVTVAGQCTSVSIETTLGDEESGAAKRICDSAAEVAYSGDTNSIRVLGGSGRELSVGIAGAKCLAG